MVTNFYQYFPIEQTKIKYSIRNEWINKKEIIERKKLFIYKKKYHTQENQYKTFRNKNISNQRNSKRNHYLESH